MSRNYNINIGDRLVRGKGILSKHHGIYVGYERGLHWVAENQAGVGVRVITYEDFLNGNPLHRVEPFYGNHQILLSNIQNLIGKPYDLLTYNCEHFVHEAYTGVPESKQINNILGGLAFAAILGLGIAANNSK